MAVGFTNNVLFKVLAACPDFKKEIGALQDLLESKGHILLLSPKVRNVYIHVLTTTVPPRSGWNGR